MADAIDPATLARALKAFAAIVGAENVFSTEEDQVAYSDHFASDQSLHQPAGAIAPVSVEEIQAIVKVANELKWLANEYPATFVFAGVGLEGHGLFSEGRDRKSLALAQTGRRWMQLEVNPFDLTAPRGDRVWEATLLAIEKKLVLARMKPGMLTDLHDYLFIRSTGVIGSLMQLIRLGSARAIRTGRERLDEELLEEIKIDAAGQAAQGITAAQLARHRLHHPLRGRVKKK